jgi:tRNA threonylcarbamoyl adenosine modification protein YjeE
MYPASTGSFSFNIRLEDEAATLRLMADIAAAIAPGDLITLSGDLGAGKTTFARALIRHLAGDPNVEVPSPTFTLVQAYELNGFSIVHADLYRLSGPAELGELGFEAWDDRAITLLEWPDRAGGALPPNRFDLALTLSPQDGESFRQAVFTGFGACAPRAERIATLRRFLGEAGFASATRSHMQGDASSRAYERLDLRGITAVLMVSPKRPDGPPVRDGKPYSAIAHLAESVTPFVAMAQALREAGFSAPAIISRHVDAGLLLLEDLGQEPVIAGHPAAPIGARYEAAVDVLAALHRQPRPERLLVAPGIEYRLPHYDLDALMIETELLLDWYLPKLGVSVSDAKRDVFLSLWRNALLPAVDEKPTWVLRDFHSPNLLWLPQRTGIGQVGLLDFQDAVMGPAAYDVASLLQDARVDIPEAMEIALLSRYTRARLGGPNFDPPHFVRLYATLAAQRASKILGIFARLEKRDGKPQYVRHMPRVWAYLQRAMAHPSLAALQAWYRSNVPPLRT